ncbi:hypothetical protein [Virgisporangium aurantiacum]|uniref:Lactococcin 972 family bacteriocin n=1 Tax=Virgisporangium aurantiacum TaxID=175570 RepID=A0A8J3ZJ63_9ACTN|nr:hypothetical protein [Virgisporangium aurantiacum]GIJ62955.1 hypothetical protein Vau01_104710 [Virgisporangium aurantiacum]
MKTTKLVTATLALATAITLFSAVPAQAAAYTVVAERSTATASADGGVLPQAGWRYHSSYQFNSTCNSVGWGLTVIGQAEDWTCVYVTPNWQLHLYAWWY